MKKWFIVIALAMVLLATLVVAQTKEPSIQEKYLTSELGRLNGQFQLFQRDMNNFIAAYPDYKMQLEKVRDDIFKDLQVKFQELQKQLDAEKAKHK